MKTHWIDNDQTMNDWYDCDNDSSSKTTCFHKEHQAIARFLPDHDLTRIWPNYDLTKLWQRIWTDCDQFMIGWLCYDYWLWLTMSATNQHQTMTRFWPDHKETLTKPWPSLHFDRQPKCWWWFKGAGPELVKKAGGFPPPLPHQEYHDQLIHHEGKPVIYLG